MSGYVRQIPVARRGTEPVAGDDRLEDPCAPEAGHHRGRPSPGGQAQYRCAAPCRTAGGGEPHPVRLSPPSPRRASSTWEDQRGYWVAPISGETLQDILSTRSVVEVAGSERLDPQRRRRLGGGRDSPRTIAFLVRSARASFRRRSLGRTTSRVSSLALGGVRVEWLFRFCSLLHDQFDRYRRVCRIDPIRRGPGDAVTFGYHGGRHRPTGGRGDRAAGRSTRCARVAGCSRLLDVEPDAPTRKPVR